MQLDAIRNRIVRMDLIGGPSHQTTSSTRQCQCTICMCAVLGGQPRLDCVGVTGVSYVKTSGLALVLTSSQDMEPAAFLLQSGLAMTAHMRDLPAGVLRQHQSGASMQRLYVAHHAQQCHNTKQDCANLAQCPCGIETMRVPACSCYCQLQHPDEHRPGFLLWHELALWLGGEHTKNRGCCCAQATFLAQGCNSVVAICHVECRGVAARLVVQ